MPAANPTQEPATGSARFACADPAAPARYFALVPCAGSGSRAGTVQPKQYQPIAGQPLVMHTLQALAGVALLHGGLVVLTPGDDFAWPEGAQWPDLFVRQACGGETRAHSVFQGLQALTDLGVRDTDWVLVHDAARCLVTPQMVDALIDACADDPVGGLLALPLPDTLKQEVGGRSQTTVPRADKWLAQTPQMFRLGALRGALAAKPGAHGGASTFGPSAVIAPLASHAHARAGAPCARDGAHGARVLRAAVRARPCRAFRAGGPGWLTCVWVTRARDARMRRAPPAAASAARTTGGGGRRARGRRRAGLHTQHAACVQRPQRRWV